MLTVSILNPEEFERTTHRADVEEWLAMREPTYDFDDIEDDVIDSLTDAMNEGLIHPGEYSDEWEIEFQK